MKVWVVEKGFDYNGWEIVAVCLTEERAKAIEKQEASGSMSTSVTEYEVI